LRSRADRHRAAWGGSCRAGSARRSSRISASAPTRIEWPRAEKGGFGPCSRRRTAGGHQRLLTKRSQLAGQVGAVGHRTGSKTTASRVVREADRSSRLPRGISCPRIFLTFGRRVPASGDVNRWRSPHRCLAGLSRALLAFSNGPASRRSRTSSRNGAHAGWRSSERAGCSTRVTQNIDMLTERPGRRADRGPRDNRASSAGLREHTRGNVRRRLETRRSAAPRALREPLKRRRLFGESCRNPLLQAHSCAQADLLLCIVPRSRSTDRQLPGITRASGGSVAIITTAHAVGRRLRRKARR